MILVTLGTHGQPMDRVVEAIDELLDQRILDERVIVQSAAFARRPRRAEAVDVVDYEVLSRWAHEADVVVTHGGPGSIMLALAAGRRPVVVPRQAAYGEHVDDHQVRFGRWIGPRRGLRVVEDIADLAAAIDAARSEAAGGVGGGPSHAVIDRLRNVIETSLR